MLAPQAPPPLHLASLTVFVCWTAIGLGLLIWGYGHWLFTDEAAWPLLPAAIMLIPAMGFGLRTSEHSGDRAPKKTVPWLLAIVLAYAILFSFPLSAEQLLATPVQLWAQVEDGISLGQFINKVYVETAALLIFTVIGFRSCVVCKRILLDEEAPPDSSDRAEGQ